AKATATSPVGAGWDVLLRTFTTQDELDALAADNRATSGTPTAGFIDVRDDRTLRLSCAGAMALPYTVIHFADPTKIPLEIVLAAAESAEGKLLTTVADLEEAAIVFDVLERGSDGILY
ncbi:3-dehydroquinate synthase II, partial [Streptomyces sp. MCAF7]